MNPAFVLLLAFLIGVVAGLRSLTAPAVVAWAARLRWIDLGDSFLAFMGTTPAALIFTVLALGEFVVDKLPATPSRTVPQALIARAVTGALSGAALALAGAQSWVLGAIVGMAGGVAGAFAGRAVRVGLVGALQVPDFVIAVSEDVLAVAAGLLIVPQF